MESTVIFCRLRRGNVVADEELMPPHFANQVGERLRAIRLQKNLSLHDVEALSSKEFKASVLGAYERGERTISVPRLQGLAMLYDVPVDRLLPRLNDVTITLDGAGDFATQSVRIDLAALAGSTAAEAIAVDRFTRAIQMKRGDYNGRVLTIRADDLKLIAAVLDLSPETLWKRITALGLRATSVV